MSRRDRKYKELFAPLHDPAQLTVGENIITRVCPPGCDGNTGLRMLYCRALSDVVKESTRATTAEKELDELRAFLDEVNAHLAWAREDGKRLNRALRVMAVWAVRCDGCHKTGCAEDDAARAICQRKCVEDAIGQAIREEK